MKPTHRTIETTLKALLIIGFLFLGVTISPTVAEAQSTSFPGQSPPVISTYAGIGTLQVNDGLTITEIGIGAPGSVISDGAGGFYFTTFQRIYRAFANGTLTLIAGNGAIGFSGDGGPATSARLSYPRGIVLDSGGNLFIADQGNYRIRKVTAAGIISTVAGNGTYGFSGDGGPATSAQMDVVDCIAVDGSGNLFIPDANNLRIRKVTPNGIISTVVGNGTYGFSGDGGPATSARIASPTGIAVDGAGNLFFADQLNSRIRRVTAVGIISTVAGTGIAGFSGDGGPATSAQLGQLNIIPANSIAVDGSGNIFIADLSNYRIRRVSAAGIISTVAGTGTAGFSGDGGPATSAQVDYVSGIAVDGSGNLFIADSYNSRIRKVTPAGIITTVAGNGTFSGDGGPASFAQLSYPSGVAIDRDGNLLIADSHNNRIGKVSTSGIVSTFAGNGTTGDGGPAATALLSYPTSVAVDKTGRVIAITGGDDPGEGQVRSIDTAGIIRSNFPNNCCWYIFDGNGLTPIGEVTVAGIAADGEGNLFVAETSNHSVWKITPAGVITLVVGDGNATAGFSGDGGPAKFARLSFPNGLAVDKDGNLFIADSNNNRIRKVTPAGIITTVAGSGTAGFSGDGGPATSAQLWYPLGVAVDKSGSLFIADSHNNRIREVTPDGIMTTVVGNGTAGFSGDGGPAASAQLNYPTSIAIDGDHSLFVADYYNDRIRKVSVGLTVLGITPNSAGRSRVVNVTLDGVHFDPTLVIIPIDGITVSNLNVISPTSATATFTIAGATVPGARYVTVTTSTGTSNTITFMVNPPPGLTSLTAPIGVLGTNVVMTMTGTGFGNGLTVDAGSGIAISDISVTSATSAVATFTIAPNAVLGAHSVTVTTTDGTSAPAAFNVVLPFPDLTIAGTHSANFEVGFTGTYTIRVSNVGLATTTGAMTITDDLPSGFTFVSGGGAAWPCSAVGQTVTCVGSGALGPGASTTLDLLVAVSGAAASGVAHVVSVATAGDLIPSNNSASDVSAVSAIPVPSFVISPSTLGAGAQATLGLTLPAAFPHDVTGSMTLGFSSNAAIPLDDPAIQFASGGRQITFVIPANTLEARFSGSPSAGPIGFQTGTVAGALSFSGTLQAGTVQTNFSPSNSVGSSLTIPKQAPSIRNMETSAQNGFAVVISLWSTMREVTQMSLTFSTTTAVTLSCGSVSGCSVSRSTMTFDVRSLFNSWFSSDTKFGSLTTLHLPFSISGTIHGTVGVRFQNSMGSSNTESFPLP